MVEGVLSVFGICNSEEVIEQSFASLNAVARMESEMILIAYTIRAHIQVIIVDGLSSCKPELNLMDTLKPNVHIDLLNLDDKHNLKYSYNC